MAVTITSAGSAHDFAVTSLPTGATVTVATGDWLVAVLATASNLTVSFSDSGGNVWTNRVSVMDAAARAKIHFATAPITSAFSSGTVTATLSSASGQDALQVYRVRPGAGESISFVAADTTGADGNLTTHAAATVSVANGNIIFGGASLETNDPVTGDSDTTNGSWSSIVSILEDGGSDLSSIVSSSQYKSVNATGNQSWACSTTSARQGICSYLVLHVTGAVFSLAAAQGQYTLSGTAMTPKLGHVPLTAVAGSYALTGTAATFINTGVNKSIVVDAGSYSLLGTDATLTHGYKLDATTAGSYALTGTDATLRRALPLVAADGTYSLTGTDATLTKASIANKVLGVDSGIYALTGTDATLRIAFKVTVDAGSYALTGSDVALSKSSAKVITAEAGSYVLTGTAATLTAGVAAPSTSPLHIGEWPIDKKKRQRREAARAQEQKAKDRFRRAIERLLEGLPPEFDEPEALDKALDSAVQAANLLYAMSAPIREINAVNELIDHIRQLRIAQPIAQLHLAQAYNQAHRHLKAKAEEDAAMTLLLGE